MLGDDSVVQSQYGTNVLYTGETSSLSGKTAYAGSRTIPVVSAVGDVLAKFGLIDSSKVTGSSGATGAGPNTSIMIAGAVGIGAIVIVLMMSKKRR